MLRYKSDEANVCGPNFKGMANASRNAIQASTSFSSFFLEMHVIFISDFLGTRFMFYHAVLFSLPESMFILGSFSDAKNDITGIYLDHRLACRVPAAKVGKVRLIRLRYLLFTLN